MSNQKHEYKEYARKSKVAKRIEDIRAELEEVLERLGQIEVCETWTKTWRMRE